MQARTELLKAIKANDGKAVAQWIKQVDIIQEIEDKLAPIQIAAKLHHWSCVEAIVSNVEMDPTDKARYGYALHIAVQENHTDMTMLLLAAGATKVKWLSKQSGNNHLHRAVRNNNVEMTRLLLSFGFDLTERNAEGFTPVYLAAELHHWECVKAIAQYKKTDAEDKAEYRNALYHAVYNERVNTARMLLEAGARTGASSAVNGDGLLHFAVRNGDKHMIKLLLSFGYNAHSTRRNDAGQTPTQLAASLNLTEAYTEGWMMYQKEEASKIAFILTLFVQAKRQPDSSFYNFSNGFLEASFLRFFSREVDLTQHTIKARADQISAAVLRKRGLMASAPTEAVVLENKKDDQAAKKYHR